MKCIVGMSGGVDSSVSVALLKQKYKEIIGCTFRMFDSPKVDEAISDAKKIAERLQIPHIVCDCSDDFQKQVIDCFAAAYQSGCTPNPCVTCNRFVKFHWLEKIRKQYNADTIATGHYARILKFDNDRVELHQAVHKEKDQSYFLYQIAHEILKHTEMPLGHFSKTEVREIAKNFGIHVAEKPDSQDICFIPNGNYIAFVKKHIGYVENGDIINESGEILGHHTGTINFTIGQRKGLGLSGGPFFVKDIKPILNQVIVGNKESVRISDISLDNVKFINGPFEGECDVKIRSSNQKRHAILVNNDGKVSVKLKENEYGIAKGQHCVFYLGTQVLGGGIIC
ncbi:MAG: tRNA 2-thiouridine(34) synthase MnmA [Alphaproteobacteria bacterium]|nr:tRNA 2-thiouridine(34) synthase MnmA [Alphaproteobacteria bacterium]